MSRTTQKNPLQDIQELERKLKEWKWIKEPAKPNDNLVNLAQCHEIIHEAEGIDQGEEESKIFSLEVQELISSLKLQTDVAKTKVDQGKMKVELVSQEAQNKIIYKMDSEDIRSSMWKLVVAKERLAIFEEAFDMYTALSESLTEMLKIQQKHWLTLRQTKAAITPYSRIVGKDQSSITKELIPITKVLSSQFYEMKVRAKLCYEEVSRKTLELSRKIFEKTAFDSKIIFIFFDRLK